MSRALTVTFNLSFAKPDVGSAIRAWAAADRPELGCEAEDGRLQAVGEEGEDGGGQPSVAVQGSQDVQGVYLHTGHAGCVPTHSGTGLAGCSGRVPTHRARRMCTYTQRYRARRMFKACTYTRGMQDVTQHTTHVVTVLELSIITIIRHFDIICNYF